MKAKKSFGQHFLNNSHISQQIADAVDISKDNNILEVGPGKGALTKFLILKNAALKMVEADADMKNFLVNSDDLDIHPNQIIQNDFLKLDLSRLFEGEQFHLVGNFPYNISSQIMIHMLQYRNYIPSMVGMFQKELADRIISPAGSKTYGTLSVLTQMYYEAEKVLLVKPGNFNPPPKVDSMVIRCIRRQKPIYSGHFSDLQKLVRTVFGQRRKMLRNTLQQLISKEKISTLNYMDKRPEALNLEQFKTLAEEIFG